MATRRAILAMCAATLALVAQVGTATAKDLFLLEPEPASQGHVITDASGNGYVAWTSQGAGAKPEPVRFCKIPPGGTCTSPKTLPIPAAVDLTDSVSAALPVFGAGSTVYVVGPRYAHDDVIIWTSTDGGLNFDAGVKNDNYSSKTEPTDVFLSGSTFLIGAYNAGLGFSTAEAGGLGGSLSFADPGSGGVASASMDLDGSGNPVIAYWNLDDPYPLMFYRYKGAGSLTDEANWAGPVEVTKGYEPTLAGGPAGLFMVSEDYRAGSGPYPDAINLRRFEGASFGPPRTLAINSSPDLFIGGGIAQSSGGKQLIVAWPGVRGGDGAYVMRLFSSTDGGKTFSEKHIAHIGNAYGIGNNAELAVADGGSGWLLYTDSEGLKVADLTPIAAAPKAPPAVSVPPIYKGKTKLIAKKVGAFLITLRLPKRCVQSRQRFFAGVGKRKRKALSKKLRGKLRVKKVVFFYDGRKLRVKKRKPFRYLIDPGAMAPGSVHVVKARVTAIVKKGKKKKKVKRTLKGKIRAC